MMNSRLKLVAGSLLFTCLASLFLCVLPRDPGDPANAMITPVVKNSQGMVVSHSAEDTVYRTIEIGAALHLPEYFDSVKVVISAEGVEIKSKVLSNFDSLQMDDTAWFPLFFDTPGVKKIVITPYSSTIQLSPVSAMIVILNGTEPQKENHRPALTFNGNTIVKPGETCQLTLLPTDEDDGQNVTLSLAEPFEGATLAGTTFTWTAPATFVGVKTLKIKATDNGVPPKDTTIEIAITVTATPHPPALSITGKNTVKPGELCSLAISASDEDAGQTVTLSMTGAPNGATLIDNVFKWTAPDVASVTYEITFTATDNGTPPLSNKSVILVSVSSEAVQNTAPKWEVETIDRAMSDTGKLTLSLSDLCNDPEEDLLTYALLDGTPEGDAVAGNEYRFTATPAAIGTHYAKITATDPDGLSDTLVIKITIENIDNDVTPPVITLITPSGTSATASSASFTIDALCSDPSGVASAIALFEGNEFIAVVADNHYKMTVTGLKPGVANVITISVKDASPAKNEATKVITVTLIKTGTVTFMKNDEAATGTMEIQSIKSGESAALLPNAFSKPGYRFAGWATSPTGTVTYADEAELTMGTSDVTLYAVWIKNTTFQLTIAATNGTVTKAPDLAEYDSGAVVKLTPVPAANHHFTSWSGALTGTDNPATITMNGAKSITATFEENLANSFPLTVLATNGTVKKSPDLPQYTAGTVVGLKATPAAGYSFVNWSGDATGTADSVAVTMSAMKSVTANFKLNSYTLTISKSGSGTTTPATTVDVNHGVATSLTATPATGYEFVNWTTSDAAATIANATSSTTATVTLTGNASVTANFRLKSYTLTISKSGSGTTTPATPTVDVNHGVATSLTAVPATGYEFVNWTTSDAAATIANATSATTATVTLTGNASVTANFKLKTYTLTISKSGSGTTTPATPTVDVNHGVATSLTAVPATGYEFVNWTTSDAAATIANATSATTATVTLTGNASVTANFKLKTYTLTISKSGSGTTTPASTVDVNHGVATSLTATPATGYEFVNWTTSDAAATIANATSLTAATVTLTGNASVTANFRVKSYTLTITKSGSGTTTPATTVDVNHGVATSLTATPAAGNEFVNWTTSDAAATIANATSATTATVTLTGNATIRANFIQTTYSITYDKNGGTGTVPIDNNKYPSGSQATIMPNSGSLVSGTTSFAGWMTATGTATYSCGQKITITGSITLYAKYMTTEVMDNDGNIYTSKVYNGTRWLLQNLKTTKYRNGNAIDMVESGVLSDGPAWVNHSSGAYCWPQNNINYKECGALYNLKAMQTGLVPPAGWRLPTQAEWQSLFDLYTNEGNQEGCKLLPEDTTYWETNVCIGNATTNWSEFKALANGNIADNGGHYSFRSWASWWGAGGAYADISMQRAWYFDTRDITSDLGRGIRCVKE